MNTNLNSENLFDRFRIDSKMNDKEWLAFCRRYAERDMSTVLWHLKRIYTLVNEEQTEENFRACMRETVFAHA